MAQADSPISSFQELSERVAESNRDPSELFLAEEAARAGRSEDELVDDLARTWEETKRGIRRALAGERTAESPLAGNARRMWRRVETHDTFGGDFVGKLVAYALAAVEDGVAVPSLIAASAAAAPGVVPSFFMALEEENGVPEERLHRGFFVAAGIGRLAAASGGRPGVAAAMAAGAGCFLVGGNAGQLVNGAALALAFAAAAASAGEPAPVRRSAFEVLQALTAFELAMANVRSAVAADGLI